VGVRALCHEIKVHQAEPELQNEALTREQAELAISEKRYRDIYEFAPAGHLALDSSGVILNANLTSASILGTERTYLMNNRFQTYLHQDCPQDFEGFLCRVMDSDVKQTAELQLKGNGRKDLILLLVEAREIEDGTRPGLRMAIIDVTERTEREMDLYKDKWELEERAAELVNAKNATYTVVAAKAVFITNMSY
jgi:two-component system, chemotaxis family, sensor kinase Cph1